MMKKQLFQSKCFTLLLLLCSIFTVRSYGQVIRAEVSANNTTINLTNEASYEDTITIRNLGNADLEWSLKAITIGEPVFFEKQEDSDETLVENQDSISHDIVFTRGEKGLIYNVAKTDVYDRNISPVGTLWQRGKTSEISTPNYRNLRSATGYCAPCLVGNTYSMYLPYEDRYFDFDFTSYSNDGFAYNRREIAPWATLSLNEGTITSLDSTALTLTINSEGVNSGEYIVYVELESNETTIDENLIIPYTIIISNDDVVIESELVVSNYIYLNNTHIGDTSSKFIEIGNNGDNQINIENISESDFIQFVDFPEVMPPNSFSLIEVLFSPTTNQQYSIPITIESSNLEQPKLITLNGTGLAAGKLSSETDSIVINLEYGAYTETSFTIDNIGTGSLNWDLSIILEGSEVEFTKEDYADPSLIENQDQITPSVFLTRNDGGWLYNAKNEEASDWSTPTGTTWSTSNAIYSNSDYSDFRSAIYPKNIEGSTLAMKTIAENRKFQFSFDSFTQGDGGNQGNGGGFSYTRTEIPSWVTTTTTQGWAETGTSNTIFLNVNADQYAGRHEALIVVNSNYPINERIEIPLVLNVIGSPSVLIKESILADQIFFIGRTSQKQFKIKNNGSDVLILSDMISDNDLFVLEESTIEIQPGEVGYLTFTVTPETIGAISGSISFNTNDELNSSLVVEVSGNTISEPTAEMTYNPIYIDLDNEENIVTEVIKIANLEGDNLEGDNLEWSFFDFEGAQIQASLNKLNAANTSLLVDLPNYFVFNYDGDHNYIEDGGNDMYDRGNYLSTNQFSKIPYSDNIVKDGSLYFGEGTQYFTRHLEGLFVLEAELNNISNFGITGNLGADGSGTVDTLSIEFEVDDIVYTAYVQRIYNANDPSIHEMIIIPKTEGVVHTFSSDTDNDNHMISGIENVDHVIYLLFSEQNAAPYSEENLTHILAKYLFNRSFEITSKLIRSGITADPIKGVLAAGDSTDIILEINKNNIDLSSDSILLELFTNDPKEEVIVPIYLDGVPKFEITNKSTRYYNFGTHYVDQSPSTNLNITNTGFDPLIISNIVISDTVFKVEEEEIIIERGESYPLSVEFSNYDNKDYAGILTFNTNDLENEEFSFVFAGKGTSRPRIEYNVDFEGIYLSPNQTKQGVVTVTNTGDEALRLNYDILDENGSYVYDQYWTVSGYQTYTSKGQSFDLTFDFVTNGANYLNQNYTLRLNTNDPNNSFIDIPFSININSIVIDEEIDDFVINEGEVINDIDLTTVFSHSSDETLYYNIVSSDDEVVSINVENDVITHSVNGYGEAVVSIAVSDDFGNLIYYDYNNSVNGIIQVNEELEDISIYEDFDSLIININNVFEDEDGDGLLISVSNDDENVAISVLNDSLLSLHEMGIGTTNITLEATDGKYSTEYAFSLEVLQKLSQTITFDSLSDQLISTDSLVLTATSDSELEVTYTSSDESVATVENNVVTILSAGSTVITAYQEGDSKYYAADSVPQELVINKLEQEITFDSLIDQLISTDSLVLTATSDSELEVTYTSSNELVATVENNVVTILSAGSTTITASQEGNEIYYEAESKSQLLNVLKLNQIITFEALEEKFVDHASFELEATSDSELEVTYTSSDESVATIEGNIVTIVGAGSTIIIASQEGDSTFYSASSVAQELVINKLSQEITFVSLEEQLVSTDSLVLSATSDSELEVTYTSSDESVATVNGSVVTIVGAGAATITASQAGNEIYLPATSVAQELVINKLSQEITFASLEEQLVSTDSLVLSAISDSELEVTYTSSDESVATVNGSVVTIVGAGATTISASQEGNAMYDAAIPVNQLLVVGKLSQSISFESLSSQLIDADSIILSGKSDSGLDLVYTSSNESIATIQDSIVTIVGVGSVNITATQDGDETYLPASPVNQVLTVNKLSQTITFEKLETQSVDLGTFELNGSSNSGLDLVYSSSNEDVATIDGATVTILGAGSATITATQNGNAIYLPANAVSQVLVVEKLAQTITFEALANQAVNVGTFELTGTSTSGEALTYTSSDESIVKIDSTTATVLASGTVVITASHLGNETYLPASSVSQILVIDKLTQEITFGELASQTVDTAPFELLGVSNSGLEITYSSSNESVVTVEGTTVTVVGAGIATITATQLGDDTYLPASAVSQQITIEKLAQTITFDALADVTTLDETFELSGTTDSGLELVYTSSNPSVAIVNGSTVTITGVGTTIITANQLGDDTYEVADAVSQELLVQDPKVLSVDLEKELFTINPNPAVTDFKINSDALGLVQIYSTSGLLMKEVEIKRVGQSIEVNGLSSGLYIVLFNQQKSKLIIK